MVLFLNFRYLQNRSLALFCLKTPPQALDDTSFIQYKPFKGGLPYLLSQKWWRN